MTVPSRSCSRSWAPPRTSSRFSRWGTACRTSSGRSIAALYPIARACAQAGNEVKVLLGSRDRDHLILYDRMQALDAVVEVASDDGSVGIRGFVTELVLKAIKEWHPDKVIAVGPVPMMRAVSILTKEHGVPTVVSLNAIMLDGTGMCGTCRCEVGGETRFSCVDGPEFDGHLVDFEMLTTRLSAYKDEERVSRELFGRRAPEYRHACREEA
jgi:ferredoxin--NADP+ reductase